jgi:hypothetical protein
MSSRLIDSAFGSKPPVRELSAPLLTMVDPKHREHSIDLTSSNHVHPRCASAMPPTVMSMSNADHSYSQRYHMIDGAAMKHESLSGLMYNFGTAYRLSHGTHPSSGCPAHFLL